MNDDLTTRVAVIERELGSVVGVFQKFDTTLEKLSDISQSLKQMIAVHDNRLLEREKADISIFELIERRKEEYSRGVERMHQRMEDFTVDIHRQLREGIEDIRNEIKTQAKETDTDISDLGTKLNTQLVEMGGRIDALERWRWLLLGGGIVAGAMLEMVAH